jgi:hypothetical protein
VEVLNIPSSDQLILVTKPLNDKDMQAVAIPGGAAIQMTTNEQIYHSYFQPTLSQLRDDSRITSPNARERTHGTSLMGRGTN